LAPAFTFTQALAVNGVVPLSAPRLEQVTRSLPSKVRAPPRFPVAHTGALSVPSLAVESTSAASVPDPSSIFHQETNPFSAGSAETASYCR